MPKKYPLEQRERSIRMVLDRLDEYPSVWAASQALGPRLGVGPETLRKWVVQVQVDQGERSGPTSEELAEIKSLRAQVRDLTEANDLEGSVDFLREGARPSPPLICEFIDAMRADGHGVESTCQALREQGLVVAPRSYRAWKTRAAPPRAFSDAAVVDTLRHLRTGGPEGTALPEVLYGRRKMTRWLARNGFPGVSKHTVDRLMRQEKMNGLVRGRTTRTTVPAKTAGVRAPDLLQRHFNAPRPNHAWVTDFTYVPTWCGFVYVAFAIDLFSRAIVGWSASTTRDVTFVEQCLAMALWRRDHTRRPVLPGMIHHSDAGSQYTSVRFTETLALQGLSASIGTVGDALDNAAAETVFGLYKNEAVAAGSPFRTGPLRHLADVETLTMNYVHWYNENRLHSELDYVSPEEHEHTHYAATTGSPSGDAANKKTA